MKRVTIAQLLVLLWPGILAALLQCGPAKANLAAFGLRQVKQFRSSTAMPSSTSLWSMAKDTSLASSSNQDVSSTLELDALRRRTFLQRAAVATVATMATATTTLPWTNSVAHAGLLDDYGTDPKALKQAPPKAGTEVVPSKPAVAIDPTLRGSYYYPTAKKRYLPRIIKVSAEINSVPDFIAQNDWVAVADFGKVAENAILPLQLYQSSLDGQGLSMNNAYARAMKDDALQYEKAYQRFAKAVRVQNGEQALQAVSDMGVAIADYRQQGRLSDDDGNIPSVDDMRRMAMRRQTGKYNTF